MGRQTYTDTHGLVRLKLIGKEFTAETPRAQRKDSRKLATDRLRSSKLKGESSKS